MNKYQPIVLPMVHPWSVRLFVKALKFAPEPERCFCLPTTMRLSVEPSSGSPIPFPDRIPLVKQSCTGERRMLGADGKQEDGNGPGRVVCQDGSSTIWVSHGDRLLRCAPENLRPASLREWNGTSESLDQRVQEVRREIDHDTQQLNNSSHNNIPPEDDTYTPGTSHSFTWHTQQSSDQHPTRKR